VRRGSLVGVPMSSVWLLASGGLRISLRGHVGFIPATRNLSPKEYFLRTLGLHANGPRSSRLRSYVWPLGFPDRLVPSLITAGSPVPQACDGLPIGTLPWGWGKGREGTAHTHTHPRM